MKVNSKKTYTEHREILPDSFYVEFICIFFFIDQEWTQNDGSKSIVKILSVRFFEGVAVFSQTIVVKNVIKKGKLDSFLCRIKLSIIFFLSDRNEI